MTVYLVGAGPGDPDLLTRKAERLLRTCDVVVHDRLVPEAILELVPVGIERIDVGKRKGHAHLQAAITERLVQLGRVHRCVVRLKGGDPFVFGRGGEEATGLRAAGVAFEIVPGVSASIAAPAYAGIPVTQRGVSACVTVVTGHRVVGDEDETDWDALARVGGTIVILMGVTERARIAARLMAGGRSAATPVAAIEQGTLDAQRVVRCRLDALASLEVQAPAVIVIGAVAGIDLSWFEPGAVCAATG